MRHRAIVLLLIASLAGCGSPARVSHAQSSVRPHLPFDAPGETVLRGDSAAIPLTKVGPFYYVDVKVNGRPFRFTLETGAGFFMISGRAARALGLRVDSVEMRPGARDAVAMIDSVTMPGVAFQHLTAAINPSWDGGDFDGIISISVLHDLLATIDLRGATLRLARGSLPEPNGRDILPIAGQDRGQRVDVMMDLGAVSVPVVLDTRSFVSIMLPDSLESLLALSDAPMSIGTARGPTLGSFALRGAHLSRDIHVGALRIQQPAVTLRNRPGSVVGVPFLEQFIVTIDQRTRRVRFAYAGGDVAVIPPQDWETGGMPGRRVTAVPDARGDGPVRVDGSVPPRGPLGFNLAGVPGGSLMIVNVGPGSNADRAGLRNGDRIVALDGTPVASMSPDVFHRAAARTTPVSVVVLRGDATMEFMITPQPAP